MDYNGTKIIVYITKACDLKGDIPRVGVGGYASS